MRKRLPWEKRTAVLKISFSRDTMGLLYSRQGKASGIPGSVYVKKEKEHG